MPAGKPHILFVEDHKALLDNLSEYFTEQRCEADFAHDGLTALHLIANHHYDVIVLDIMLPGVSGLAICERIRKDLGSSVPVILLTSLDSIENKIEGFGVGANDYLCKPFDMRELELRIRALCKPAHESSALLKAGAVSFHPGSLMATVGQDKKVALSGLNAALFETLIRNYPDYVPYEEISKKLWGVPEIGENIIRTHVYNLRKILKQSLGLSLIKGVYGRGYQLDPEQE